MDRQITTRPTPEENTEVIITQGGYDFVNIKGTTTVNIYAEHMYLKGGIVLCCYNMGGPKDSFKNYVKYWLREEMKK